MDDMGSRIKQIRKNLSLTQTEFGKKIGLSYTAIGMYENQKRAVSEHIKKSICQEFNVNYLWLTTGKGEMFMNLPKTSLDRLAEEFSLNESEKELIREFVTLPEKQRKLLMNFLRHT